MFQFKWAPEDNLCTTLYSVCYLSTLSLPFKVAALVFANYFWTLYASHMLVTQKKLYCFCNKKFEINFWPVGEKLLCKTFKGVCHLSSSWLPFKVASFMKPNYFGTWCAFHLYRSHQQSCTDFLLLQFSEKKMQMKLPTCPSNLVVQKSLKCSPYR